MKNILLPLLLISLMFISCQSNTQTKEEETEKQVQSERYRIEMQTTQGTMILELYNETPKHRDNFVKLTEEGAFDSLLFHRVIENFMIQGGDPDSRNAGPDDTLGNGDRDYRVDAEFRPNLFHKKGVLAAARDGNLERASSAMQFYIVQGKIFNDSLLQKAEERINGWMAVNQARKDTANLLLSIALEKAVEDGDMETYRVYNDSLKRLGMINQSFELYQIPEKQKEVYKTLGGAPHLDQNYTVFGEVVQGLEVVDSIATVPTGNFDRPLEDVRIIKVMVLK
jgi:cyclophilin family peptidyl-prolyl cis-trans isomerase